MISLELERGKDGILLQRMKYIVKEWKWFYLFMSNIIQLMTFHKVDTAMYQPRGSYYSPKPTAEVNITSNGLINQCPPK